MVSGTGTAAVAVAVVVAIAAGRSPRPLRITAISARCALIAQQLAAMRCRAACASGTCGARHRETAVVRSSVVHRWRGAHAQYLRWLEDHSSAEVLEQLSVALDAYAQHVAATGGVSFAPAYPAMMRLLHDAQRLHRGATGH